RARWRGLRPRADPSAALRQRARADTRGARLAAVHEPRAGGRRGGVARPGDGRLWAGGDPLRTADRRAAGGGGFGRGGPGPRPTGCDPATAVAQPERPSRAGGGLPEGDGPEARGPLPDGAGAGRRHRALAGRRAGVGVEGACLATPLPVATASPP